MPSTFIAYDEAEPAGLARRCGGLLYDFLILVALYMLIGGLVVSLNQGEALEQAWMMQALLIAISYGFFGFFWRRSGQTLGMLAWRLRIETHQGQAISWAQVGLRMLGGLLGLLCFGLGYLWLYWDPHQRTWSDIFSNTRTLVLPKPAKNKE